MTPFEASCFPFPSFDQPLPKREVIKIEGFRAARSCHSSSLIQLLLNPAYKQVTTPGFQFLVGYSLRSCFEILVKGNLDVISVRCRAQLPGKALVPCGWQQLWPCKSSGSSWLSGRQMSAGAPCGTGEPSLRRWKPCFVPGTW